MQIKRITEAEQNKIKKDIGQKITSPYKDNQKLIFEFWSMTKILHLKQNIRKNIIAEEQRWRGYIEELK